LTAWQGVEWLNRRVCSIEKLRALLSLRLLISLLIPRLLIVKYIIRFFFWSCEPFLARFGSRKALVSCCWPGLVRFAVSCSRTTPTTRGRATPTARGGTGQSRSPLR
jgi:hypothetical protein